MAANAYCQRSRAVIATVVDHVHVSTLIVLNLEVVNRTFVDTSGNQMYFTICGTVSSVYGPIRIACGSWK